MSVNFQFNLGANKLKILTALAFVGGEVVSYNHHNHPTEEAPDNWQYLYDAYSSTSYKYDYVSTIINRQLTSEEFIKLSSNEDFFSKLSLIKRLDNENASEELISSVKQAAIDGLKHSLFFRLADNKAYITNHRSLVSTGMIKEEDNYWKRKQTITETGIAALSLLKAEVNRLHSVINFIDFNGLNKIALENNQIKEI